MSEPENLKLEIGQRAWHCNDGYRVIGLDTSSGRPWMWYAPTIEAAKLLAQTLVEQTGTEVEICQFIGATRLQSPPTMFVPAKQTPNQNPL